MSQPSKPLKRKLAALSNSLPLKLPGFGFPLNQAHRWKVQSSSSDGYVTNQKLDDGQQRALLLSLLDPVDLHGEFADGAALRLIPLRELVMLRVMNSITDKPGWENKVFDTVITTKWKEEVMGREDIDFTDSMWNWVIAELQFNTERFKKTGTLMAYDSGVVKSDTVIPESLKLALRAAVSVLENIPEEEKDYHPHSNDQVLDLVHPSLFPVVYGRTRINTDGILGIQDGLAKAGSGEILQVPPKEETEARESGYYRNYICPYSQKFQWLPCDVQFTSSLAEETANQADGANPTDCKIVSYINNLHPTSHGDLYGIIEQVISLSLPLWNMTLTATKEKDYDFPCRIEYTSADYKDGYRSPSQASGEDSDDYYLRYDEWEENNEKYELPSPRQDMEMPSQEVLVDLKRDYAETGLQVIVKLANIHLTPEKPEYNGGSWHVEGQLNEHICATALYYYDSTNITDSRLAFRQLSDPRAPDDIGYRQNDRNWTNVVFGVDSDGPIVQDLGDVSCIEGRLLTFPNVLQHRVAPFSLADPSKPGHRKILALFLVDPNIHIISSAHVPVQRKDWFEQMAPMDQVLGRLPRELADEVEGYLEGEGGWMMGMEEAKKLRLELMEERKAVHDDCDKQLADTSFSLCEH
ncbi:chromatin structure-remodeling complex protein RSC7 [Blastomyces parvus]|uniref:Chromatin structure-remodeling complex protein RSC7 n=1 Tax=Blastomyces parvus TaxID=2060905 RepID=A0A2B7WMD0_9EURO|nr:chromatin structure-remodeling complex protein RSC7 [Blastomyces parvus]